MWMKEESRRRFSLWNKEVDLDSDAIKVMLCSSAYTPGSIVSYKGPVLPKGTKITKDQAAYGIPGVYGASIELSPVIDQVWADSWPN